MVNYALHNVIEEVNAKQKGGVAFELMTALREAKGAISLMDSFDMDVDMKQKRYQPNKQTLFEICEKVLPPTGTETYIIRIDKAIQTFKDSIKGRIFDNPGLISTFDPFWDRDGKNSSKKNRSCYYSFKRIKATSISH